MGYIGQTPSAVPLTSADIADGTITNDDLAGSISNDKLAGSITDAKISSLSASKLTGTLPASMDTDLSPVRSDILKLAIHQGIDGNRTAFNLNDSFIDTFEDDSGITTETTVDRDTTAEYVSSILDSTVVTTPASSSDWTGNTGSYNLTSGHVNATTGDNAIKSVWTATGDYTIQFTLTAKNNGGFGVYAISEDATHADTDQQGLQNMTNSWHWHDAYYSSGTYLQKGGSNDSSAITSPADGSVIKFTRTSGVTKFYDDGVLIHTFSGTNTAEVRFSIGHAGAPLDLNINDLTFTTGSTTVNATGTLISDPQTASTSRTSASGVIIYEDADGTNTLGGGSGDLRIYFTANNGTNWTEAASYGTATTYSGTKKLVKLGATTVTAGTQVAMKAVWANQSSSTGTTKTVTAIDGAHHDNVQAKIGSTSIFCDGTNDAIEVADSNDFAFAGDYTVEFWVYFNGAPANNEHICGQGGNTAGTYAFFCRSEGSGTFIFGTSNGSTQRLINPGMDLSSAWHHVAMVKYGTSQKLYIDGTSAGTPLTHSEPVQNVSAPWEFSGGNNSASHISAWWDEIRFSNVARYTGNFTAFGQNGGTVASPTAFTTDANTVLLIHGDGSNGSTTLADSSAIAGKEARLHGWAVNY
jgi:hypothetical protein